MSDKIKFIFYQLNIPNDIIHMIYSLKLDLEKEDEKYFQIKRFFFHSWIGNTIKKIEYPYNNSSNLYSPNIYVKYRPLRFNDPLFYCGGPRNKIIESYYFRNIKAYDKIYSDYLKDNIHPTSYPPFYIGSWIKTYLPTDINDIIKPNVYKKQKIGIPTMLQDMKHYHSLIKSYLVLTDENLLTDDNIISVSILDCYHYCQIKNCKRCKRINNYSKRFLITMDLL